MIQEVLTLFIISTCFRNFQCVKVEHSKNKGPCEPVLRTNVLFAFDLYFIVTFTYTEVLKYTDFDASW